MNNEEKVKQLNEFTVKLETMTLAELEAIEAEVIKECDEANAEAAKVEFELPSKGYKEAAEAMRYFLNKQSVRWEYTMGLLTMYETWAEKKPKKVNFPTVDSTLRLLGDMQFTGYEEWKKVNVINAYFAPIREEYIKVTEHVYYLAAKHNAIMDKLDKINMPTEGFAEEQPIKVEA